MTTAQADALIELRGYCTHVGSEVFCDACIAPIDSDACDCVCNCCGADKTTRTACEEHDWVPRSWQDGTGSPGRCEDSPAEIDWDSMRKDVVL